MKLVYQGTFLLFIGFMALQACQEDYGVEEATVPLEVINQLKDMGFNPDGIEIVPEGYRIERDIIIRPEDLQGTFSSKSKNLKQYSTNNLVSTGGSRTITVYIPQESGNGKGKNAGFNANYVAALDIAIARFNAENLELNFQRVSSSNGAEIQFEKLSKRDENQGYLGSAGFPTNSGDPYGTVKMNSKIDTRYGWSRNAIATVMAHELGHCIGFRHTDYFDRSISCGGSPVNEGPSEPIGANHIPGTPTGATLNAQSWMLSCTGGGDRPFNNDDKTALDYLY